MIPHAIPNLSGNESRYLQECVETNFVSSVGPFVSRFEKMVSAAAGTLDSVATSSGTTGLHASLAALGVGPGDLVAMPALTFVATANAISHCGATPWLFDVEPANWTLSAAQLAHVLNKETRPDGGRLVHGETGRRVAAIMPVFTLGAPPNMASIMEVAADFGLPVVVDAAAALGATPDGAPIGQCGPDLFVFSFNGNKTVTAGGGGAVSGNNKELLGLVRHLTTTARVNDDFDHDRVGFNYRMTNLQAAVGCAQMERLPDLVGRKEEIHAFYKAALSFIPGVATFAAPEWGGSAHWLSGILLGDKLATQGAEFRNCLKDLGVDCRPIWKPMHLIQPYKDAPRTSMPVTDQVWRRIITLPSSTGASDDDLQKVADAVKATAEKLGS